MVLGLLVMLNQNPEKQKMLDKYTSQHDRKRIEINWSRIGRAIEFYKAKGYHYIEVPWIVEQKYREITYPFQIAFTTKYGDLVGSAEQSFLAMHFELLHGKDKWSPFVSLPGKSEKFVACTPCFRDHQPDDLYHMPYFMKVELFELASCPYGNMNNAKPEDLFYDAGQFFISEGAAPSLVKTEEGVDWFVAGIEVGSYGQRKITDENKINHCWNYATGLAEPRFSQALAEQEAYIKHNFAQQLPEK